MALFNKGQNDDVLNKHCVPCRPSLLFFLYLFIAACSFDVSPDGNFDFQDPIPLDNHDNHVVPTNNSDDPAENHQNEYPPQNNAAEPEDNHGRPPNDDSGRDWDWDSPDPDDEFEDDAIFPASGPVMGNTRVHITGYQFNASTRVFIGSQEMSVTLVGSMLVGRTPPAPGIGTVPVRLIHNNGQMHELPGGFTYYSELGMEAITPTIVSTTGGVQVDIHGKGFDSNTSVSFSGRTAARIDVLSDTLLRAITPTHPRGLSTLRITTTSETLTKSEAIEFYTPLESSYPTPIAGDIRGDDVIALAVDGLTSDTTFFLGGIATEILSADIFSGAVTLRTPPHAVGRVDLIATNRFDTFWLPNAYNYIDSSDELAATRLYEAIPPTGHTTGGDAITLVGQQLNAGSYEVYFGSQQATIMARHAGYIVVETPPSQAGLADIVLMENGSELTRLNDAFQFIVPLEIDSISPASGPAEGNQRVTLTGTGFNGVTRVNVGLLPAQFSIVSDTEIELITPASTAGKVDLLVGVDNRMNTRLQNGYEYLSTPQIWSISPSRGAIAGGTYVHLRGQGFAGLLEVELNGIPATQIRRIDNNNAYFYTPPNPPGTADIDIRIGGSETAAPHPFLYFNPLNSFGGAWGDIIDGALNITVLAMGGSPIPNAQVILSTNGSSPYHGQTDGNGQVVLSGPDVRGPQTITATAAGFSSTTVQTVDAENITVFLSPRNSAGGSGAGASPPIGTIQGNIRTLGKLSSPHDQSTIDMSVVRTTQKHIFGGNPVPGPRSVVVDDQPYELRSRVGDVAVVALCGTYHSPTEVFTPQYMGVQRYLVVADQGTYTADIDCTIPLDNAMEVKLTNTSYSPNGPNQNIVEVYWDFGFEGLFPSPTRARGLSDLLTVERQPDVTNHPDLMGVTYTVVGGSYTNFGAPYSQTQQTGLTDLSSTITLSALLPIPEPLMPLPGNIIENNTIHFVANGPHYPDLYQVILLDQNGIPVWEYILPGEQQTIVLPQFPDFSHLPADQQPTPFAEGPLYLIIYGIRIPGFEFDRFTYHDFSVDTWEAFTVNQWVLQLAATP